MVTVVATQELKAGDFLLGFEAEASQDDNIHGSVFGNCCYTWDFLKFFPFFLLSLSLALSLFGSCVRPMICAVFLLMFAILYKVTTHACG